MNHCASSLVVDLILVPAGLMGKGEDEVCDVTSAAERLGIGCRTVQGQNPWVRPAGGSLEAEAEGRKRTVDVGGGGAGFRVWADAIVAAPRTSSTTRGRNLLIVFRTAARCRPA